MHHGSANSETGTPDNTVEWFEGMNPTYVVLQVSSVNRVSHPADCHVTLRLDYDPGMSCIPSRLEQDPLLDPHLDYTTQLTPDIQVDYRGRTTGVETEQRFPKAIDYCLPFDDLVVVGLDPDSDGIDAPTFQYEKGRNLVAIDRTGDIAWVAEPITDDGTTGYYYTVWRIDDSLLAKPHGLNAVERPTVELNPENGVIVDTAL